MTRPDPHASYREHVSSKAEAVEEDEVETDLVKRLLRYATDLDLTERPSIAEYDITRDIREVCAQLATARKALEPFAAFSKYVTENRPGWDHDDFYFAGEVSGFMPRMKAFRAARSALNSGEQKQIEDWPYPEGNPTCAQDLK